MAEKKTTKTANRKIPKRRSRRRLSPVEIFVGNHGVLVGLAFIAILIAFMCVIISSANAKDVDLNDVCTSLKKNTDITSVMKRQGGRELKQFVGLNANDYDQFVYYRNTTALAVDELLIVKAKDSSQLDAVGEAVEARIRAQLKVFESYGPEQCAMLKNAIQTEKGKYYFYCTADKADVYEEVLLDAVQ